MKKMIVASTSTIYGGSYLEYILPTLEHFFKDIKEILFIPYARPSGISYKNYTEIVSKAFSGIDIKIIGIHEFENINRAVQKAEAIYIGGGNTFVLVDELYRQNLMVVIKDSVENGTLYFGTSAGSNVVGLNMQTTNDMPIVNPKNYKTLGLIPLNINPHYLDPDPTSKHKGESRETRIKEFHTYNEIDVLGLREGSWLEVAGNKIILKGSLTARLFQKNKTPTELKPESNLNNL